jgi:prepilin-type N-terminal cleavage/methylation domain-containing protein
VRKTAPGFTLIETLVASAVLAMLFAGVLVILQMLLTSIGEARVRVVASSLAQERLETAKNLPFDEVGTVGGIPPGSLPQEEAVVVNGQTFSVVTTVLYIDDAFDSLAPTDPIPNDYKRVRVTVDWDGTFKPKTPQVMSTDVAPAGLEFIDDAGTLIIRVFNSQGVPLSNAQVRIQATSVTPPVDLTTTTNVDGMVMLPGAPMCFECYSISATKAGYSLDKTYTTTEVANPTKPQASVFEGQLTEISFVIDALSSLSVTTTRSRQANYALFPGVSFTLQGTKTIGTDVFDEPVYKYSQAFVTGALGQLTIPNLEWDLYSFLLPAGSSIDIAGIKPLSPFPIVAGSNTSLMVVTIANTANSLLMTVMSSNDQLLPSASITMLVNGNPVATQSAGLLGKGDEGQAYFGGLPPGSYDFLVSLASYATATGSVTLSGDMSETILLSGN